MTHRKTLNGILALVAVTLAAVLAGLAAPAAHAAGYVGSYAQAAVTCDSFTNQLKINARIAVASNDPQRVAYELYAQNVNTGQWTRLLINGKNWEVIDHQPVVGSWQWSIPANRYEWQGSINYWAGTSDLEYRLADGTYTIWVRYIWEAGRYSNVWVDVNGARFNDNSPWIKTTGYTQPYMGYGFPNCSL